MNNNLSWDKFAKGGLGTPKANGAGAASPQTYADFATLAWAEPVYAGLPAATDKDLAGNTVSSVSLSGASVVANCDGNFIVGTNADYIQYDAADIVGFAQTDFLNYPWAFVFTINHNGGDGDFIYLDFGTYSIKVYYSGSYLRIRHATASGGSAEYVGALPFAACSKIMMMRDSTGAGDPLLRTFLNGVQQQTQISPDARVPSTDFSHLRMYAAAYSTKVFCHPQLYTKLLTGFPGLSGTTYTPADWADAT